MMKPLVIALAAMSLATAAQAATVYGVDGNDNLVTFNSANPGAFTSSVKITGAAGVLSLDFRPRNGVLYGLASDRRLYTIDTTTGVATATSDVLGLGSLGTQFALDFNPTIDRLRIVSNSDDNFVFNPTVPFPAPNPLTVATSLFYVPGDVNFGLDPNVTALAYTSSTFGSAPGTTQLYGIDTIQDVLVKVANSAGRLETVGALNADLGSRVSFDIEGDDAFVTNGRDFYRVDLAKGGLTRLGRTEESLFGVAIAVPEPSTWALTIGGFGMAGAMLRRRRAMALAKI